MASVYDKLIDVDPEGELEPMLATDWRASEDGETYTLSLREDVEFQDGTKFDAEAVKFNLDRYREEDSARAAELEPVEEVVVKDAFTVEIRLNEPFSPLPSVLADRAGMMASPAAVQEQGDDFANAPAGTGPFELVERVRGGDITLDKNENYWKEGQPKLQTVIYRGAEDENVHYTNLRSGQFDIVDSVPFNQLGPLSRDDDFRVYNEPELGYQGMWLNTSTPPFDDEKLRRAVYTLVNREAIVSAVLRDRGGEVANSPFAPTSFAYGQSDEFERGGVREARRLLEEAGKPDGFTFTLTVPTSPVNEQLGQVVQHTLEPAGIEVELERVEFGTLLVDAENGNFDALQLGWSGRIDPDQNIYEFLTTGDPSNYSRYSNEEVDRLLSEARRVDDEEERKRLYDEALRIIHEEAPYIYLYHENSQWGMNDAVRGFEYNPDGVLRTAGLDKSGGR